VALLVLPLLLIGAAEAYEWTVARRQRDDLGRAADAAAAAGPEVRAALALRHHALIATLDGRGEVVTRTRAADVPLEHSAIGTVGAHLVGARDHLATLEAADALGPPWPSRPEVRAALAGQRAFGRHLTPGGEALLITLAQPLNPATTPPGEAPLHPRDRQVLYLVTGSHRGIRRLALVQRQLAQLLIYALLLALPLVLWFAFGLVRPLERLAAAARRYPAAPLADADLLRRRDEIGALARTLSEMADDLDARRRGAADLGADIAHEFKNPLASIAAAAELLTTGAPPTSERLSLVTTTIAGSVERLRRSIDELLRLLRMEDAMAHEARTPVDLASLLRTLADEYARDPAWSGWRFEAQVADDARALAPLLDEARVAEMLRNLIDNALVQPATDRRVVLGLRRTAGELVVSVRDQGPGISRENQARIFRRFFTQRPAGAPAGTGLGLSIVDSVARAHGGRVDVVSEPGQGAEFRVFLPI